MKNMFKKVGEFSDCIAGDMSKMKDKISQTFHVVADHRYKVGSFDVNPYDRLDRFLAGWH